MTQDEFSTDPLTPPENAEVRAMLASRKWWRQLWAKLSILAARLKLISGLLPWVIGLVVLLGPERIRGFLGW